jgi:hypothetical protein
VEDNFDSENTGFHRQGELAFLETRFRRSEAIFEISTTHNQMESGKANMVIV